METESILHDKRDHTCFLCMMLHEDYSWKLTEEHHVFFGKGRKDKSESYGLKVQLCIPHHRESREAVHRNIKNSRMVQAYAQRAFEKKWPEKNFREIFGRNYILDAEIEAEMEENVEKSGSVAGFILISDGLEGMDW